MQPAGSRNASNRVASISSQLAYSTGAKMAYKTRAVGAPNTLDYRVFIEDASGKVVSPFHDIPLYANADKTILNCVIESTFQ
jgi:inorganic pyrophosphatase